MQRRLHRTFPLIMALTTVVAITAIPTGVGQARPKSRTIPWGLKNCEAVIAVIPIESEQIDGYLPKGFTAVIPPEAGSLLPPDPRLDAAFGVEALSCESGHGLKGQVADLDYGSVWTFVEPPEALKDPSYPFAFVKWDTLVPDAPRRDVLTKMGFPARDGSVAANYLGTVNAGLGYNVDLSLGDEQYSFKGGSVAPVVFSGKFIEYMPGSRGIGEWRTDFSASSAYGGSGLMTLDPDSLAAEVVGATEVQAYFLVAVGMTFSHASFRP